MRPHAQRQDQHDLRAREGRPRECFPVLDNCSRDPWNASILLETRIAGIPLGSDPLPAEACFLYGPNRSEDVFELTVQDTRPVFITKCSINLLAAMLTRFGMTDQISLNPLGAVAAGR